MTADDWLSTAADQAHRHVGMALRPRFGSKRWQEFDQRLDRNFECLFRLLHRLYGWQYDFAWTVETMTEVAANAYLERPKRLRRADRRLGEKAPAWITQQATTWVSAPLGAFMGDLDRHVGDLEQLGVTHLHLKESWPDHALLKDLQAVAENLAKSRIGLVLDLACNHTPSDHPWAQSAAAGGPEADFYFFFPDRTIPDRFAQTVQAPLTERGGDSFTWHPDVRGGRWVWTTFDDDHWDLNYSNPRVLAAMAAQLLALANVGAEVIRLDHTPFLWKTLNSNCEGLPEAHIVVQVLRVLADIAAPAVVFLSGAKLVGNQLADYVNPAECRIGYNTLLTSSIWEALATNDTRLLGIALGGLGSLVPGCAGLNHLLDHEGTDWVFDDVDATRLGIDPVLHRRYLNSFYGSRATVGSMSGLETALEEMDAVKVDMAIRRIAAAWAVLAAASGIPQLSLGDGRALDSELSAESQMLTGIKRVLEARRAVPGLDSMTPTEIVDAGNRGVVAFRRGSSLLAANLTAESALLVRDSFPEGEYHDLIGDEVWDGHVLGPYEYRFVRL